MRILRSILAIPAVLALVFPACDDGGVSGEADETDQALDSSTSDLKAAEPATLLVPPYIYATVGFETEIFFDNVVLVSDSTKYRFHVSGIDLGKKKGLVKKNGRKWAIVPTADDVGRHLIKISVESDKGGPTLAETETTLVVSAPNSSGARLLLVGDSLTASGVYPNAIGRMLGQSWTMLGSQTPTIKPCNTCEVAAPGVRHEGRSGWRWATFVSDLKSPFLDVDAYMRDVCGGDPPDAITILLGINDVIDASDVADPTAVDRAIDVMITNADTLLARFRSSMPFAAFAVALTAPPNSRDAAFTYAYGTRITRWGWRRAQHRTVERLIEHFGHRENENIHLIPTEVGLDTVDGYPLNDAVHPNALGYEQIAGSFYAWLMNWR